MTNLAGRAAPEIQLMFAAVHRGKIHVQPNAAHPRQGLPWSGELTLGYSAVSWQVHEKAVYSTYRLGLETRGANIE